MAHDIGFWRHKPGQTLIRAFNGGSKATALATWLATSFPNLYGAAHGVNNLTGDRNSQVAAFYKAQAALPGSNVEAEVLATALNVYATTQSLGGTIGQSSASPSRRPASGPPRSMSALTAQPSGWPKKTTLSVYASASSEQADRRWCALQRRPDSPETGQPLVPRDQRGRLDHVTARASGVSTSPATDLMAVGMPETPGAAPVGHCESTFLNDHFVTPRHRMAGPARSWPSMSP